MISTREAEAAATRRRPPWAVMAVVAAGYAAGSTTAFVLFEASDIGAVFFPPAGVTLAALLLTRTAAWPWLLGTVAAVEMVVNLAFGLPMASVPGFALANVVEPLVGATLLRRFGGDLDLRRRRALGAFIGCAVLAGPFVGALIGATTNYLAFGRNWLDAFFPFWAGDGLGALTVGGTILCWSVAGRPERYTGVRRVALPVVTAGVTVLAFWPAAVPLAYLPMPLLFAIAFWLGVPPVLAAGLAMTLAANVMTAGGRGPWAALAGTPNLEIASLQLFLAVAVLSAWFLAVEIEERHKARTVSDRETALRRRVEGLQRVTAKLATAPTSDAIADVVARHGIRLIGDDGTVGVLDPDGLHLRAWIVRGSAAPRRTEVPLEVSDVIETVTRTGATAAPGSLTLPVRIGGGTVGALTFDGPAGAAIDPDGEALARTLADLMGHALLRARLYEEERDAAHLLQQALLPEVPRQLPGVDVAGCYRPADRQHDVGGDWYDVFALPGGRVGLVVGDVVGHDLGAAAAMGRLHAALRVLAQDPDAGPARVLERLDRAAADIRGAACATLGYAEYDPVRRRLRYACAGHPPPLLVIDHRPAYLQGGRSTPLAVTDRPRAEAVIEVPAGAMLLWYSDGLVESRLADLDAGFDRLASVAATQPGEDPQTWCDAVIAELTRGHRLADDVVLLCVALRGLQVGAPHARDAPATGGQMAPASLALS